MSTKIEWTDETLNVVTGCSPVQDSPACDNCYAHPMAKRLKAMGQKAYKRGFTPTPHPELLRRPEHWRDPRKVFICSMGDLFHEHIPFEFIASVFVMMINNKRHTFQVLTKRPHRMRAFFKWLFEDWRRIMDASKIIVPDIAPRGLGVTEELRQTALHLDGKGDFCTRPAWYPRNIWGGTTVETQRQIGRVLELQQCPFNVRFLSLEPLLGPIELTLPEVGEAPKWPPEYHLPNAKEWDDWKFWNHRDNGIHWVIAGGESGPRARPTHPKWLRDVRDVCEKTNTPFFFKQWGMWHPEMPDDYLENPVKAIGVKTGAPPNEVGEEMYRVGRKRAGSLLDGVEHKAFPTGSERP